MSEARFVELINRYMLGDRNHSLCRQLIQEFGMLRKAGISDARLLQMSRPILGFRVSETRLGADWPDKFVREVVENCDKLPLTYHLTRYSKTLPKEIVEKIITQPVHDDHLAEFIAVADRLESLEKERWELQKTRCDLSKLLEKVNDEVHDRYSIDGYDRDYYYPWVAPVFNDFVEKFDLTDIFTRVIAFHAMTSRYRYDISPTPGLDEARELAPVQEFIARQLHKSIPLIKRQAARESLPEIVADYRKTWLAYQERLKTSISPAIWNILRDISLSNAFPELQLLTFLIIWGYILVNLPETAVSKNLYWLSGLKYEDQYFYQIYMLQHYPTFLTQVDAWKRLNGHIYRFYDRPC